MSHTIPLQDWVNYTQNLVCKYYAEKVLVHGDPEIMPLISDRTNHSNSKQIVDDINHLITYTGYVCDNSQKKHEQKNNLIYVSTGLNKEEGVLLFKEITKIAKEFEDYTFVMPVANRYLKTKVGKKGNLAMVDYVPNLRSKLVDCAAYITYGGYNATVEILQSSIPSIIIPRQDGQKMEQFVRAYTFEPFDYFKVLNNKEFHLLAETLKDVINNPPAKFDYSLDGAKKSAEEIVNV